MKQKLKNIDFKHLFIVLLITLLIGFCVLAICLLNKFDENRSKTILNKNDDLITLNVNTLVPESNSWYSYSYLNVNTSNLDNYINFNNFVDDADFSSCTIYRYVFDLNALKGLYQNTDSTNYVQDFSNLSLILTLTSENYSEINSIENFGVLALHSNVVNDFSIVKNLTWYNNIFYQINSEVSSAILKYSYNIDLEINTYNYLVVFYYQTILDRDTNELFTNFFSCTITENATSSLWQQQYNDLNNSYDTLNNEYQDLDNNYATLNGQYASLDSNYQTLLEQYNALLNQTDYSFSELFWSISAVPFGVLTSAFNINVLGVNLALNNYGLVYCYVVNLVV